MNPKLQQIYDFFKPMPETKVWACSVDATSGAAEQVCVSWEYSDSYMVWYLIDGHVKFTYMRDNDEPGPI